MAEDSGVVLDLGSLFLPTDKLITMNAQDPEDPTPLETDDPSPEGELGLGSASSPGFIPFPPCPVFEDVILDRDIFMLPDDAVLPEDHSRPSMQPPEDPAVSVPDLLPTFGTTHAENPTELVSSQRVHETEQACFELLRLMTDDDSVRSQVDQRPEEVVHSFPPPYLEAMENAAISPGQDNLSSEHFQEQFGLLCNTDTDLGLASVPQLPSSPIQPPMVGANQWEEQSGAPPLQLQPFQDLPKPSVLLNMPSTSNYVPTEPCISASQGLGSDYPQLPRLQQVSPSYLQPVPHTTINWMQPNHQLTSDFFQPSIQPTGIWFAPYSFYMMCNQSSGTFGPQVPQMYMNSPPTLFNEVPLLPSPDLQRNIGSVEQPLAVLPCFNGNNHPQEIYNNYRRWQMFCKAAASVYTSSPDVEALACFFMQVIRSITHQNPGIPRLDAVNIAVSEWERLSNAKRKEYYHMAQRYMDLELKEMESIWMAEAPSSLNTEQQWQTPTVRDEPPAAFKGHTKKQSPYTGRIQQKARSFSRTSCCDQAEMAPKEYSEVMEALKTNNKKECDDNQDQEVVYDDDDEDLLTEFLNELQSIECSQKFFSETTEDISLLLSPDSNSLQTPDNLKQLDLLDEECHSNPQTTDESISAATPEPQPQTLQPVFYVNDGAFLPPLTFSETQALLNRSSDLEITNPDKSIPIPTSSTGLQIPSPQNSITQDTFETFPLQPEPLLHLQMSSDHHENVDHPSFVLENSFIPILTQEDAGNLNDHSDHRILINLASFKYECSTNELCSEYAGPSIIEPRSEDNKQASSPRTLSQRVEQLQSIAWDPNGSQNDLQSPENPENKTLAKSGNNSDCTLVETTSAKDTIEVEHELGIVEVINDDKQMTGNEKMNEGKADLQDSERTDMSEIKGSLWTEDPVITGGEKSQKCGTSEAKEAVEEPAITEEAGLSLDYSEECLRVLRSDASAHFRANVPVHNPSEEMTTTTGTESNISMSGSRFERGKVRDLEGEGRTGQRSRIRSCKISQRHQVGKIGIGMDLLERRKKMKTNLTQSRVEPVEVKREEWKRVAREEKDASRCRTASPSAESLRTPAERLRKQGKQRRTRLEHDQTSRQPSATSTTGLQNQKQKVLVQDQQTFSRKKYRRPQKNQAQGKSLKRRNSPKGCKTSSTSSSFALVFPKTERNVKKRANEGQEEMEVSLTRAKRANEERSTKSLPTKRQKLSKNSKAGFQLDMAKDKSKTTVKLGKVGMDNKRISRHSQQSKRNKSKRERAGAIRFVFQENKGRKWKRQEKGLQRQRGSDRQATLQKRAR